MSSAPNLLPMTGHASPIHTLPGWRKWSMLVVLSSALAVIILDTTILNVALSSIIRDLGTNIQSIQWVITAYSLTLAALTITGGRMGDLFGKKRMFVLGAILFAIGSFIASVSGNVAQLVIGESIIEGIGAALMMPATASLLVENFVGRERAMAFGIWGGIAGASAALGPILGGFLATNYSWRWGFRVNLFVVAALLVGSFLIPRSEKSTKKGGLDIVGILLSATGMLSLVFGIIESSRYGFWKAKETFVAFGHSLTIPGDLSIVPVFVLLGAIIIAIYLTWENFWEKRGNTPLTSLSIFKNRQFTAGVITTMVMSLGQTGLIFSLPVFLQSVRGLDAYHTGLALLPMSLPMLIVAPLSAVLGRKISAKLLIMTGLFINMLAYSVLYNTLTIDVTANGLIPGIALFGVGMGLVMSQITNITLSAVDPRAAGEASGINNTLRQVGSTLGSAIIGAILIGALGSQLSAGVQSSLVIPNEYKPALVEALGSQTSNIEFGGGAHISDPHLAVYRDELTRIGHQATVDASKKTLAYGGLFALLGFFSSFLIPGKKRINATIEATEATTLDEPTKVVATVAATASTYLDTKTVNELLSLDLKRQAAGQPGLASDLQLVLDAAALGLSLSATVEPKLIQARTLWAAGFGRELGYTSFADYAASLPNAPLNLRTDNTNHEHLVLVDARLSAVAMSRLLGVALKTDPTVTGLAESLHATGAAYWIRANRGTTRRGLSVAAAEATYNGHEASLSIVEGLSLLALAPESIDDHFIDLAASKHDGHDNSTACLGRWQGATELRFRWRDHADARCGTATKLV